MSEWIETQVLLAALAGDEGRLTESLESLNRYEQTGLSNACRLILRKIVHPLVGTLYHSEMAAGKGEQGER